MMAWTFPFSIVRSRPLRILLAVDLDVQVFDFKQRHRFLFHVDPSS